tara:strand:- start:5996 stop:6100 length:105 start_codon:yes stop_codon:yes gene_type:complete
MDVHQAGMSGYKEEAIAGVTKGVVSLWFLKLNFY